MKIEEKIIKLLKEKKQTLCIAESCTGGLISNRLTNVPGASNPIKVGIIAYSNESKIKLLKVKPKTIAQHGAVSEETAIEMAKNARLLFNTNYAISVTGIAGPTTGATNNKPIGQVYIAVAAVFETLCLKCLFKGMRTQIRAQAATQALKLLLEFLK